MPTNPSLLTRIFSAPEEVNDHVDEKLIEGLSSQFPIEGKNFRLEASNFRAERKYYSHDDEKTAILQSKSLTYPIKADLRLVDKLTGKPLDEVKGFSLMDSFHMTGKHSMIYKGNNYVAANQLQLLPGVYTRSRETGELESHFNTATGRSFSVTLDPESQMFYLEVGSSQIPAAPLLTEVFGSYDAEVAKYVPLETWKLNVKATQGKESRVVADMYKRMVSTSKQLPDATKDMMIHQLRESLEGSKLSPRTTEATLGKAFTGVTGEAVLRAMHNLVQVHAGNRTEDNRDSLQFKRVQNLPDFLKTRFDKEHQVVKRIKIRMGREIDNIKPEHPTLRGALSSKPFNKFFSEYITSSNLISTPSETNPLESIENVAKVTVLGAGEGGIASDRGVPMGARDIHPSHLGVIDPSRTPESGHAGIDQRFTITARRDKDGNLYARVVDNAGKTHFISVHEMMTSVVGFPGQKGKDVVQAHIRGELGSCKRSEVQYWLSDVTDMYTITTNLVPFLNSNHPGRLTMAGKAIPQALSLVNREVPLVQTVDGHGNSFVKTLGSLVSTSSPVDGTVTKVTSSSITIRPESGPPIVVKAVKNLPFNMKGFHDDEKALVKEGDVVKRGQVLFESNYTKDGVLALGKNLHVAYLPWKGYNHEDGLVLSKSAADSLSSHHAYKVDYDVSDTTITKKSLVQRYYPGKLTKDQLANLDDFGYARVGTILKHGDPVYAVLEKKEPTAMDKMLGRMHKLLVAPVSLRCELWTHDENGVVVDAHTEGKQIRFIIRSVKPLEIGDKLTGFHGNKGIVSLILPDEKMPYVEKTGKPVDILLNPASVTSRINLAQLMETGAAKLAHAAGKPYMVHNYSKENNVKEIHEELKAAGLSGDDHMIDPTTKKPLPNVLNGHQYFLKLYKTSDQNWSARNIGSYDNNLQPTKGGEEGSKSVGYMEMLGLMGSDARHNLREVATAKSELSQDHWEAYLNGRPLPKPKMTFATQKFFDYLKGSGINVKSDGHTLTATPLTDRDITGMSNGTIKVPEFLNAKDLSPVKGGFFDPVVTGGLRGTKWSHYALAEPLPNPAMERPIKSILGLSTKEYEGICHGSLGVTKKKDGFHLQDVVTGGTVRVIQVNSFNNRPVEQDLDEEADDEALQGHI